MRTEKEELIEKIGSIEDSKYALDNSGIRARRGVTNDNLVAETLIKRPLTPTPSIEVNPAEDNEELEIGRGTIVPKISLQESQDDQEHSVIVDETECQKVEVKNQEAEEDGHGQTVRFIFN